MHDTPCTALTHERGLAVSPIVFSVPTAGACVVLIAHNLHPKNRGAARPHRGASQADCATLLAALEKAGAALGLELHVERVREPGQYAAAFDSWQRRRSARQVRRQRSIPTCYRSAPRRAPMVA